MTDDALIAWLNSGGKPSLPPEEESARRRGEFSRRFVEALRPLGDLGVTCEEHELGVARNVYEVHAEVHALGETEYDEVWKQISAPDRRALKAYIDLARRSQE